MPNHTYHFCSIHDHAGSGRCPFCVLDDDVTYAQARQDAFYDVLNNISRRTDLVSDQSDRQDTALTELESKQMDLEDAHNTLVAYVEQLNGSRLEDQGEMRSAYNHCLVEIGDLRRRVAALESQLEDMHTDRKRIGELEDQLGFALRLFAEHGHPAA